MTARSVFCSFELFIRCSGRFTDGKYNDAAVYLHVRKVNPDRSVLLTVSVINRHDAVQTYTENSTLSLFQCTLTLRCDAGFQPVYRSSFRRSPEEEKNDMLYDAVHNFAYGHGCSTVSTEQDGIVTEMQYTLRLLTLQQFERATALVCACESMRQKYGIPGDGISIGLWIGSGMTPNHVKDAEETLKKTSRKRRSTDQ